MQRIPAEEARLDPAGTDAVEIEPSRLPEPDVTAKRVLRFVFLGGVLAVLLTVTRPYPLLSGQMATIAAMALCLCAGLLLFQVPRDLGVALKDMLMAMIPWLIAATLFSNGAFDTSPETLHQTVVIRTSYSRRSRTLIVQSWRTGRSTESLALNPGFWFSPRAYYYSGQTVTVGTRAGSLGMPWVTRISAEARLAASLGSGSSTHTNTANLSTPFQTKD